MKLVYLVPLGIDQDIGRRKLAAEALAAGIAATAATGSAALSANSAAANSHMGRVYSRWALHQQEAENQRAREFQSRESAIARQWEEQMYNLYNSPSAMMRQYKEAGINPYLANGLGSGMSQSAPLSSSGASGISPGSPPGYMPDFSSIGNLGSQLPQALGIMADVENVDAKTRQTNVETFKDLYYNVSREAAYKFADSNGLFVDKGGVPSLMERSIVEDIYKKVNENAFYSLQNTIIENYGKDQAKLKIDELNKILSKIDVEISVLKSQKDLNQQKGYELGSEIARNLAAAGLDNAVATQYNALLDFVKSKAFIDLGVHSISFLEQLAEFEADKGVREYMTSPEGQSRRKAAYENTPAGNYVLGLFRGLKDNVSPFINGTYHENNTYNNTFVTPWSGYAR